MFQQRIQKPIQKFSTRISSQVRSQYEYHKHNFSHDTAIYYFAGGTLIVVALLYILPLVWGIITKPAPKPVEIAKTTFQTRETPRIDYTLKNIPNFTQNINAATEPKSREETLAVLEKFLKGENVGNIDGYFTKEVTLKAEPAECCGVVSGVYAQSALSGVKSSEKPYTFDQGNEKIIRLKNRVPQYKEYTMAYSGNDTLVGFVLSSDFKVGNVLYVVSLDGYFNALDPVDDSGISDDEFFGPDDQ
jgi:hypothetical protein